MQPSLKGGGVSARQSVSRTIRGHGVRRCRVPPEHESLFDIDPLTGASIEVFHADRSLESFGWLGAGWYWCARQRGSRLQAHGPFPRSCSAYRAALSAQDLGLNLGTKSAPQWYSVAFTAVYSASMAERVSVTSGWTNKDSRSLQNAADASYSVRRCSTEWTRAAPCWLFGPPDHLVRFGRKVARRCSPA